MKEIVAMTMTDLCEMSGPSPKLFSAHSKFPYFPSQAFGNPVSGEKGRLTLWLLQAVQGHRGALGSLCLLSVSVHLRREMRIHGMIR